MNVSYMKRCLELARLGWGTTNPNPLVGCVVVKDGVVIGEGWHRKAGEPHAEVMALRNCSVSPEGADLYVNLEPCCHHGKTPPCTDAILKAGIRRCFVGIQDPNPQVAGRGIAILRERGLEVVSHVLEEECRHLNEVFLTQISLNRPYIVLKSGCSLDGRITDAAGRSRWITGPESRSLVHQWRARVSGILTGIGTILEDNPALDNRSDLSSQQPLRIILDSRGRIPLDARVLKEPGGPVLVFGGPDFSPERKKALLGRGVSVETVSWDPEAGHLDLPSIMEVLYRQNLDSVMVEAGSNLTGSFLRHKLWDKYMLFMAPRFLGAQGKPLISGWNPSLEEESEVSWGGVQTVGEDLLVESYPKARSQRVHGSH